MVKVPQRTKNPKAYACDGSDSVEEVQKKIYTAEELFRTFSEEFKKRIVHVSDFPIKGVKFADITNCLADPYILTGIISHLQLRLRKADFVVSPESRGFYFGPTFAAIMGAGFVPFRKANKVPHFSENSLITIDSKSEYGDSTFAINQQTISLMKHGYQNASESIDDLAADGPPSVKEDTILNSQTQIAKNIPKQKSIIVFDDVLATGQTAESIVSFFEAMGFVVTQFVSLVEIADLKGREKLEDLGVEVVSLAII